MADGCDHNLIMRRLNERGVFITAPPETAGLHPDLVFEPPCSIGAIVGLFQPLRIGAFSHLNGGYIKDVTIGRYCSFARDVQIGHGSHPMDWLSVSPLQYGADYRGWSAFAAGLCGGQERVAVKEFNSAAHTVIGNDVWLGNHVIIKDGVTIGDGAIVGAGSVVTKSLPAYAVAVGAPARIIRFRFPDAVIERLSVLRWWRYKLADFGEVDFSDINRAIDHIDELVSAGLLSEYAPLTVGTAALCAEA